MLPSSIHGDKNLWNHPWFLSFSQTPIYDVCTLSALPSESIWHTAVLTSCAATMVHSPTPLSPAQCSDFQLLSQLPHLLPLVCLQNSIWSDAMTMLRQIMSICCLKPSNEFPSHSVTASIRMTARGPAPCLGPAPLTLTGPSILLYSSLSHSPLQILRTVPHNQ